ncbi:MAG: hypothetical protein ACQET5_13435 [Halobacteriota archaeon]
MFTRRVILGVAGAVAVGTAGCTESGLEDVEESVRGADKRGDIVGTYDRGIGELNDGNETRDEGIVAFNDERYGDSIGALEEAIEHYEGAEEAFRSAGDMAEEAGFPPGTEICDEAAEHAMLMNRSTEEAHNAVTAAIAGESADVINGRIEASQELEDEASGSTVADPDHLLEVLEAQS